MDIIPCTCALDPDVEKIFEEMEAEGCTVLETICSNCNPNYVCPECGQKGHVYCHDEC